MVELKMPDINTVLIAGNLTCDPSFRKTTNGTPVANFYIASNRKFKDNNGQWRENVCYVGVVAWYKLAESCYENLKKGSAVIIDGELQSRSWRNNDGSSRNVIEIKAKRIQFLNKKSPEGDVLKSDDYGILESEEEDTIIEHRENQLSQDNSNTQHPTSKENNDGKEDDVKQQEILDFSFGYENLHF